MPRVIKRYDNRKLYDLEGKRYVRLSDLAEMIQGGAEVTVVDNATGADLTAETLAKVLSEGKEGRPLLPGRSLHDLVRWGGGILGAGKGQVEQWIEGLVSAGVERVARPREMQRELVELRERVAALEALVKQLEEEKPDGRNNDGDGGSGRPVDD